jgi:tetratricopeptide (TPR) repeat protein
MAQPINPYIAGAPLRGEMGFFGRQDTLKWVARELRNPATNALVLFGQRRIGKTSLLLQLQRTLPASAFLPVYFDLQDQASCPLGRMLADLADTVSEQAGLEPPNPDAFDDEGRFFQRTFLPQLFGTLGENCRPVFLLDEFDVLDRADKVALPEAVASRTLFGFLRRVMTEDSRLAFVFVVGRGAEDLTLDFSATFKASLVKEIWVLDPESAEVLARNAETNGTLHISNEAVACILSLTSCHPYLTQLLCQRVWERAYASNPTMVPQIDVSNVEAAVSDALEVGHQALIWLWNGLSPAEKIFAAALAEVTGEGEAISEAQVISVLTAQGTRLRTREVELAPRDLVKRRVLKNIGGQKYCFAVEFFRRWVRQHKPLRNVKDELDRVVRLAETLFSAGYSYFHRRQWEAAIRHFRDALKENPRHFRAQLYLGEALLERDQTSEAVAELERAYNLDQDEALYALVRALMAQAKAQEQAGDDDGALAASRRALEISPNERTAQEMRVAIWTRRGDEALEQGDFQTALAAYQEVGDTDGIAQVEAMQRQNRLQSLYKRAEDHILEGEWSQVVRALETILAEDQDYRDAAIKLESAKTQQKISTLYSAAVGFQETGRWQEAIDRFSEIIRQVGVYEDVAKRLDQAQRQKRLARWFKQGETYLRQGKLQEAVREFELVYSEDPDYRRVQVRLNDVRRQLRIDELSKRGEASFRAKDWQGAVDNFKELRELDPGDVSVVMRLEEAEKQLELDKWYREGMKHFQNKRWRKARNALERAILIDPDYRDGDAVAKFEIAREELGRSNPAIEALRDPVWQGIGVIIAIILAAYPLLTQIVRKLVEPTRTSASATLCNGDFEDSFACWQHGGELDQDVKCDGGECYAVLGNPDYDCYGGVPVGEAWMKQTFQVPLEISPTLSLEYRVFSYDLKHPDYDYFQVAVNGEPLPQQYGNHEWIEPSCDREPWDSGWQKLMLDLSAYRGEEIEVSFHNVNGTQPYFNTWTYVDDVRSNGSN